MVVGEWGLIKENYVNLRNEAKSAARPFKIILKKKKIKKKIILVTKALSNTLAKSSDSNRWEFSLLFVTD